MKTSPVSYIPIRPQDFIGGAAQIAKLLERKVQKAKAANTDPIRVLLYGQPGVGKTRLAEMVANLLASHPSEIESLNGRNVTIDLVRRWMESQHYLSFPGVWTTKIVNELDTATPAAQDLLLEYFDGMRAGHAFIGTSNLELRLLTERFQSRLQQMKVAAPGSDEIANFIQSRWRVKATLAQRAAVGCGGNVRAALLDTETLLDAAAVA